MADPGAIPALVYVIRQRLLRDVRELDVVAQREQTVVHHSEPAPLAHYRNLAGALKTKRGLQKLERLSVRGSREGVVPLFADALASGAAPSLRVLALGWHMSPRTVENMQA